VSCFYYPRQSKEKKLNTNRGIGAGATILWHQVGQAFIQIDNLDWKWADAIFKTAKLAKIFFFLFLTIRRNELTL
jgi:hypothetical protein